jgi:hypothetical protein
LQWDSTSAAQVMEVVSTPKGRESRSQGETEQREPTQSRVPTVWGCAQKSKEMTFRMSYPRGIYAILSKKGLDLLEFLKRNTGI